MNTYISEKNIKFSHTWKFIWRNKLEETFPENGFVKYFVESEILPYLQPNKLAWLDFI